MSTFKSFTSSSSSASSRTIRTLYKVLKALPSTHIDRARRVTSDFFYMYDNLPYGMQAREALDDEDLLSVPMPLELIDIDAYEPLILEEVCACACKCRKSFDVVREPVSTTATVESIAWTSTRTPLKLDFYGGSEDKVEVDVKESFDFTFTSIALELEDYTFTPSFDVDVESVLASMHAEAEAVKIQAEAAAVPAEDKVATVPVEKKVTKTTSTAAPATEAKRRQTLGSSSSSSRPSSSASTVSTISSASTANNNKNKRASVVPTAAAATIGRPTARVSLAPRPRVTPVVNVKVIASSRQPLAPVRNEHKSIKSTNISRPTSACSTSSTSTDASKPKVNLKTRVSLAPMSKKERFADLGKGKGGSPDHRWPLDTPPPVISTESDQQERRLPSGPARRDDRSRLASRFKKEDILTSSGTRSRLDPPVGHQD
ncbi:hypothetical protein FFLO_02927 [Filobasidium floriforme]|uniref:Uncharacterized protein n=1 Tax=Filobasidium floriforme TaxID=5210 RepID=A0A8K0JNP9_9TREE|nr:hypothetical protein FFLO_02927 [Filobasidium floriforme]